MDTQENSAPKFGLKETFIGLIAGFIVSGFGMAIATKFPDGWQWGAYALVAACIGFAIDWKQYQPMLTSICAGYTFGLGIVVITKYEAIHAIWPFLAGLAFYELGILFRPRRKQLS